jgi:hypothetical protein
MDVMPEATPLTEPPETAATSGLPEDQVPPDEMLVSVMEEPGQTSPGPETGAATGNGFTVIVVTAFALPQLFETE